MNQRSITKAIVLSSAVMAIGVTNSYAAEKGTVNVDVLNIRSGAGTNHSVITKAYKGNTVEILDQSSGWYKVKLSNGTVGWASGQYITKGSGNSSESSESGYGTVTTSTLNVRSGAGTSNSIIGKVYKGDRVELLASQNGWYKIRLSNGSTGWASGDYITKGSGNSGNNSSESGYGTVTTSTLNVRSGAGTSYSVIGKVNKGDRVELLASKSGWYKIKLSNGNTGWASGDYITKGSDNSGNNSGESSVSGYGTVTTSTLNVRSGAGTSYSVIGKVNKGDRVELLASKNGWYKIKLSNGSTGWASADYITKGSGSGGGTTNPSENKRESVVNLAKAQIGKPYVWGAEGPDSFDCSGLMYYIYKNAAGKTLPRTSVEQSKVGTTVSKSNLKPGDLIFSSTNGTGNVSHVGIYIGNGEMIHAPKPGSNVQKANINSSYWSGVYLWSKSVL
ncbi:C40 family peptidase [[Clostridium] dakarense]|uniref:C40 family peptidase n=1 Tax=Faecalimicrobium dakarense TaxID=1301100 RepID=UPI0004BA6555|nr:SH3 domain-containing protein [[Clostridium] dakarense]